MRTAYLKVGPEGAGGFSPLKMADYYEAFRPGPSSLRSNQSRKWTGIGSIVRQAAELYG